MRLDTTFIRLALRVDAARLAGEVLALPEEAWIPHPEGAPGNTCVPLVASRGNPEDHATTGPMAATPILESMPYHRAVLASLGAPIGRTRLMRIEAEGRLGLHVDTNRYWQEHLRVHAPVLTHPDVAFTCEEASVHMAPGEVWVFDTWRRHGVENPADQARVHLVIDTVGSSALWRLIDAGRAHGNTGAAIGPLVDVCPALTLEHAEPLTTTAPWLHRVMADGILRDMAGGAPPAAERLLRDLIADWHALWVMHGDDPTARPLYQQAIAFYEQQLAELPDHPLSNGGGFADAVRQLILRPGLSPLPPGPAAAAQPAAAELTPAAPAAPRPSRPTRRLDRPIFIVCPPRSGSSLLLESLSRAKGVFTIGGESHEVFERNPELHPSHHHWHSNVLTAADATPAIATRLDETFAARARDRDGRPPVGRAPIRLLEKTPKNALRVPFLAEAFPDGVFVYLHRPARPTISSMIEAWRSGRFVTYPRPPGWGDTPWSMLLVPGWEHYLGLQYDEVAARQWATTTDILLGDLAQLPEDRWCAVGYDALLADPNTVLKDLAERLGLEWDRPVPGPLPHSRTTLDAPDPQKWRRNEEELERVWHLAADSAARADAVLADPPTALRLEGRNTDLQRAVAARQAQRQAAVHAAFRSVHTGGFAELLSKADRSLAVTTYQSGRVLLVRPGSDGGINTHLKRFARPMGLAVDGSRLALGTDHSVWRFDDQPELAARLPGDTRHDGCYVPTGSHTTGDISIHELAFAGDDLWVVNTRFSCLATLDGEHSFVPRWRPRFVTALAAEDRCHLNGLAIVDGRPKYVTALAMTDTRQGWRSEKLGGGMVIDVDDHAIVAQGLTMPHSPRWYRDQLWVLDSGNGALCRVDIATGNVETVALLPGFTRGLAFIGRYAVVGLSKVREHVFAGLPLAERLEAGPEERSCGLWVADIETGQIAAFLRFEGEVEEVFDVQLLPHRFPELLEPGDALAAGAFVLPESALQDLAVHRAP